MRTPRECVAESKCHIVRIQCYIIKFYRKHIIAVRREWKSNQRSFVFRKTPMVLTVSRSNTIRVPQGSDFGPLFYITAAKYEY